MGVAAKISSPSLTRPAYRLEDVPTTIEALEDGRRLRDSFQSWMLTLGITLFAFVLRIWNLAHPHKVMFDETYYAKDAWAIMQHGVEMEWAENANDAILTGDWRSVMLESGDFIAHPPLGKILIGLGEQMFGFTPFGWRFAAVVAGTMLVMLTIRLARRVSRSTMVGALAGILLTFDGLAFTMSRIALLDIFQAVFAVAAVAALVADRDWFRGKLADHLRATEQHDLGGKFGPLLLWRPWRVVAGVMFGASIAVKWNTLYLLAVFGIVTVVWDVTARRLAGAKRPWRSLFIEAPVAFVKLVVVALVVYVVSWWGWLTGEDGWGRDWGSENPDSPLVRYFGEALGSLAHYHSQIYGFHTGSGMMEDATHTYEAHPAGWLFMIRTTGFAADNGIEPGDQGCLADAGSTCLRVTSGMGTPLLWWAAAIAILFALWWWLGKRDWRFSVPLLAIGAAWIPWFQYASRPLFFFYAIMIVPFSVTVLAMALVKALGPAQHPDRRRRAILVGLLVGLVIFNFAFIYPVLTSELMTRDAWTLRMWLGTWI